MRVYIFLSQHIIYYMAVEQYSLTVFHFIQIYSD